MEYIIGSIEEIENIDFPAGEKVSLKYSSDHFEYNMMVLSKGQSDKLIVMSNGAVDLAKKQPPVFMRSNWQEDISASLIYLDDPTIHGKGLKLGWGQGNPDEYVLETYSRLMLKLSEALGYKSEDVSYYGSSAGGFMSMILSSFHEGSRAIVNNPQTDIRNYHPSHSEPLLEACYGSVEEAYEDYAYRVNVAEAFVKNNNMPMIFYIQNQLSAHDIKYHFNVFLKSLKENKMDLKKLVCINYYDKETGHAPLDKDQTIEMIELLSRRRLF
jgi:hypothetical protein